MEYSNLENQEVDNSSFQEINYGGPGDDKKPKPKTTKSGIDMPDHISNIKKSHSSKENRKAIQNLVSRTTIDPAIAEKNRQVLKNIEYQEEVKKLDRLSDDQNQIVSGMLKQYGLNPQDPASFSNPNIKDYVNSSLKLNYLDSKNVSKNYEKEQLARAEKEKGFFNFNNWDANLRYAAGWVKEAVTPSYKGTILGKGSGTTEKEYNSVKSNMRKYEAPLITNNIKADEQIQKAIVSKQKELWDKKIKAARGEIKLSSDEIIDLDQDYDKLILAENKVNSRIEQMKSYIDNKDSVWDGIDNIDYMRIVGSGFSDVIANYHTKKKQVAFEKGGKALSDAENLYLTELGNQEKFNQTTKQTIDRDRFLTRSGEGVGESGVFMGQMVVTAPVGGVAGSAIKSLVSPLASKVAMSVAMRSVGMTEGRLATKAMEQLATKGIGYIESGAVGSGELLTQSAIMPATYENMAKKFIGQTAIVTDKDGNEKILLTASGKKAFEKQTKNSLNILNEEEKRINNKKELTEQDNQRLNEISLEKNLINENLNSIYQVRKDANGKDEYYVPDDISATDAFIYGYTESLKEMVAERYVGELGGVLTKGAKRLVNKIPVVGKINSPIGNAVDKFWARGQNLINNKFDNSQLGLLSSNLSYHTGGAKMFHGLPGEVLEEIAVQLTPTYTEDYSKQLEELSNPDFYVDVITQTLLMGGAFGTVGVAKDNGRYLFSKDYRENLKDIKKVKRELKNVYRNIDNSIDDNDLAVHIGMNSGDTSFNVQDYQAKIAELRNQNEFEEANRLEKNAYLNLGIKALRTGTLSEYKEKLEAINNSDKFSPETKKSVADTLTMLPRLEYVQNKFGDKINYNRIADLAINNIIYDKSKNELNTKINEIRQTSSDILERINDFEPDRLTVLENDIESTITIDDIQSANLSEMSREKLNKINNLLDEHPELSQLVDLNNVGRLYDVLNYDNNKKLNYELNPANQREIRQRHIQERNQEIINSVTPNNVEEVRNELEEEGELTPEVNSQLNQRVEQQVVESSHPGQAVEEAVIEEVKPDVQQTINNNTSTIPEEAKVNAESEFTRIAEDNLFGDVDDAEPDFNPDSAVQQANDNDALSLQPLNLDDSPKQSNVIKEYTKVLNDLNSNINEKLGREITADEAFGLFANSVGLQVAEQHFNMFKKAFETANIISDRNWNTLYNEYFAPLKQFNFNTTEVIPAPVAIEEVIEDDKKVTKVIADNQTPVNYTQNNNKVKYLGRKISVAMNKIPFLGVKYKVVTNPTDNTVTYVDDSDGLNIDGGSNLNIILNPDILVPGKNFTLEIPEDWESREVSVWSKQGEFIVQNTVTMGEWMSNNNIQQGSKEWIDKVPMDMIVDGNVIGYGVHDTAWWNSRNVADFKGATIGDEVLSPEQALQQQISVIQQGRELTSQIRQAVYNGNNEMIVTQREEGVHLSNKNNELKSLFNSNPDIQLSIGSPQGFITNKGDNGNQYFKGEIVNSSDIDKGHIYMISRLGSTEVNGKSVPTYVAHKVITNHDQYALNQLVKSRQRMYDAAEMLTNTGRHTNPTPEQLVWAKNIKDQVRAMTGISIDNVTASGTGVQYTGLGELKELYPNTVKNGEGLMLLPQMNNLAKQKLPIVHTDGSVTNYKSNAGEGYKAMLMDNLYTQKKFHTITDTKGNQMKILDVQPRIKFDLKDKNVETVREEVQPTVEETITETTVSTVNNEIVNNINESDNNNLVTDIQNIINNIKQVSDLTPQNLLSLLEQNNIVEKEC